MDNIRATVKRIISGILKVDESIIEDDMAIGDIPEWDSLHHLQIIAAIEKEFGFRFTPDIMMDLEDVDDIVNATEVRVGQ